MMLFVVFLICSFYIVVMIFVVIIFEGLCVVVFDFDGIILDIEICEFYYW